MAGVGVLTPSSFLSTLPLEENASDLCCLVSSLVQVMMDPHCRTTVGFQSLIQKEWVVGGHCFLDRCNHLRQSDKDEVSGPRPRSWGTFLSRWQ